MAKTYTTVPGDQWDIVAKKVYGDELQAGWLMAKNPQFIHIYEFDAGTVLATPDLPEENSTLPPWRWSA